MADIRKSVAVIGAGLSGLNVLYELEKSSIHLRLTSFEKNYDIGGQWLYTDQTTSNEFGLPVYSGMYSYMRTNLPLPLMTTPGFEYDKTVQTFPEEDKILSYIQTFCNKNNLRKYIKFNTIVQKVEQVDPSDRFTKWRVTYSDIRTKNSSITEVFDYVVVGTGQVFC